MKKISARKLTAIIEMKGACPFQQKLYHHAYFLFRVYFSYADALSFYLRRSHRQHGFLRSLPRSPDEHLYERYLLCGRLPGGGKRKAYLAYADDFIRQRAGIFSGKFDSCHTHDALGQHIVCLFVRVLYESGSVDRLPSAEHRLQHRRHCCRYDFRNFLQKSDVCRYDHHTSITDLDDDSHVFPAE